MTAISPPAAGSPVLRPRNPAQLPAEKTAYWMFTAVRWADFSEDQRRRWREWFEWAVSPGGELWNSTLGRAQLANACLDEVDLSRLRLFGADMMGATLRGANLAEADLSQADLRHSRLEHASLVHARLDGADLSFARLEHVDLTGADLSAALMHNLDLTHVKLEDARLFGTKITDPVWWFEMPRAAWTGRTVFPRALPEHPIQDVLGLPPLLRRQIADAQFLRDLYRKANGFGRAMMWLWGITCCFGQSLGRWTLCTFLVLLAFGGVYTLWPFNFNVAGVHGHQAVPDVHLPSLFEGMYFSVSTFMTLGLGDVVPAAGAARVFVALELILGYLMLGGLVSIFANKLARLS